MEIISAIPKVFYKNVDKESEANSDIAYVLNLPLQTDETPLPKNIKTKFESTDLNGVPFDVVSDVIYFCIANKSKTHIGCVCHCRFRLLLR